jgi:hypothetical protein
VWGEESPAFCVQAVVGRKSRAGDPSRHELRGWTYVEPAYADASALSELNAIAGRVRAAFPECSAGWVVSYAFRPGSCATEVYRRSAAREGRP